jgi:hypothetical protein
MGARRGEKGSGIRGGQRWSHTDNRCSNNLSLVVRDRSTKHSTNIDALAVEATKTNR